MISILAASILLMPDTVDVPKYGNIDPSKGVVYSDVISHAQKPDSGPSRSTVVHETSHFISSELRNNPQNQIANKKVNAFYILNGKAVVIEEPNFRMTEINQNIPQSLIGRTYQLYMVEQARSWDDRPLYVFDELNAYFLGGLNAVEDKSLGRHDNTVLRVSGAMEFAFYSLALCQTFKERDPNGWAQAEQLKKFAKFRIRSCYKLYIEGRELFPDPAMDKMIEQFKTDPECQELRDVAKELELHEFF